MAEHSFLLSGGGAGKDHGRMGVIRVRDSWHAASEGD